MSKNLDIAPAAYNTSALHRHIDRLDETVKELRGSASLLYRKLIEINFKYRMKELFFVTNTELMTKTGFSWRTLQKARKLLEKYNLIQVKPSTGRGKATEYTLRHTKDFVLVPNNVNIITTPKETQDPAPLPAKNELPLQNAESLTLDELRQLRCTNPNKYNWDAFLNKMEEYRPSPEELYQIVKRANYGEIGNPFWAISAEINRSRYTHNPIKSPSKFILSKLK